MISLIIDSRERDIIEKLNAFESIDFTVETMDVGDIMFKNGEEVIFIIERKTINDLKSSVCDGRMREQKARLMASIEKERIMYLIEGSMYEPITKTSGVPMSTVMGSMINMLLRDGLKLYRTDDMGDTLNFICKLFDKFKKDLNMFFNTSDGHHNMTASEYSSTLKKKKKANMTPEVWFISQLAMIPQVTEKVASVIIEQYPGVHGLILAYENTSDTNRPTMLADLTYPLNTGKTRRIGGVLSERIYKFMYNLN